MSEGKGEGEEGQRGTEDRKRECNNPKVTKRQRMISVGEQGDMRCTDIRYRGKMKRKEEEGEGGQLRVKPESFGEIYWSKKQPNYSMGKEGGGVN